MALAGAVSGVASLAGGMIQAQGAAIQAEGAEFQAEADARAMEFEADQLEQRSKEEFAAGTVQAEERRREGRFIQSAIVARAAASGGGAGGVEAPTVTAIQQEVAGQVEYNALMELWGGKQRMRGLRDAAKNRRISADNAREAGALAAAGYRAQGTAAVLSGIGGLAGSFG